MSAGEKRVYPGLRFVHVFLIAVLLIGSVAAFWIVTTYIPAKRALIRARKSNMLRQLGVAYLEFEFKNGHSPRKAADLDPYLQSAPEARQSLDEGAFVLKWNAQLVVADRPRGEIVLGYEAKMPRRDGVVLMADGTIHSMSADEFSAATAR